MHYCRVHSFNRYFSPGFSGAFREVYKADDHRLRPRIDERELVSQMAALRSRLEANRSVLEGVHRHKSIGADDVHPRLVRI